MKDSTKIYSVFNKDFSETVAYNNPLFPAYAACGNLSSYPDYSGISHWHRDLEFILIKRGSMTYNVNGRLVELTEGNGIMVNSRQLHYGFSADHNECVFICILLSPELLQGNNWFYQNFIERISDNPLHPYLYLSRGNYTFSILEILERLYTSFDADPVNPSSFFDVIDHFIRIMKLLYENFNIENEIQTTESSDLSMLRNMITYIEDNYMEHITLTDISLSGTCCKSKCSALFKKYLHDTPITYTTKLRLRKSLSALLESDKNIAAIAYECGFNGASYYCETFKRYYGMSPMMYKKANNPEI